MQLNYRTKLADRLTKADIANERSGDWEPSQHNPQYLDYREQYGGANGQPTGCRSDEPS
ncbi:10910_t:CDS:2 [Acaulospora colombiana]|uniref:10910_t:CDS:1 n=1 Tax=Acaulospora colombiana TaxID=27376 RepID=A0ACA9MKN9_9GLOM|nr:10910_t:CDS:2 [Acaulospora colombiana]